MDKSIIGAAVMETSRCLIVTDAMQPDNPIIFVNPAFTTLTGYSAEEAIGLNCRFLQGPDTDPVVVAEIREAMSKGLPIRREILNYRKDGRAFWNDLAIDPLRDDEDRVIGFVGVQYDASDKKALFDERVETESRLSIIANNIPGYVCQIVFTSDGTIRRCYISPSLSRILDIPDLNDEILSHVHPDDRSEFEHMFLLAAVSTIPIKHEFRLIARSGREHWFRSEAVVRILSNGDRVWDGLAVEITTEKVHEARLSHITTHDALTHLSNRTQFSVSLARAIGSTLPQGAGVALLYVDLVAFQTINDTHGQAAGDQVLRHNAQRLSEFTEARQGIAARLGGDEFAILIPNFDRGADLHELGTALSIVLGHPIDINGQDLLVETCVGAAIFQPTDGQNPVSVEEVSTELKMRAHLALLSAKREGPGMFHIYSAASDNRLRDELTLRQSLKHAIKEQQFELHYQPIVELVSGTIIGAEALVRWNHPVLGMQRPDLFIPLAESSGLIVPIGEWVLKTAMIQAQAWMQQGLDLPRLAINVSSVQLNRPGFVAMVERVLAETNADPSKFEFELTEGILVEASSHVLDQLNTLRSLGFGLAVDDFGVGYSSFQYLRDFPVTKIKIDQSFIRQMVPGSNDALIIHAMIELARSLGLDVVAEGIETGFQRNFLRQESCRFGQGYYFSLPLAVEDFGWMLERRMTLPRQRKLKTGAAG